MKEKLMAQVSILERAAKDEAVEFNLDEARAVMFDAAQRIETLEKDTVEKDSRIAELSPKAELGDRKVAETKTEAIRLLTIICEHSETKDMGRVERMKERFEKESLSFDDIERYRADAQDEFDRLFPAKGEAVGSEVTPELSERVTVDVSAYKIGK